MHIFSPNSHLLRMKISSLLVAALALCTAACSSTPDKDKPAPNPDRPGVFEDPQDPLAKRREDRYASTADMLTDLGYEVTEATSAKGALQALESARQDRGPFAYTLAAAAIVVVFEMITHERTGLLVPPHDPPARRHG